MCTITKHTWLPLQSRRSSDHPVLSRIVWAVKIIENLISESFILFWKQSKLSLLLGHSLELNKAYGHFYLLFIISISSFELVNDIYWFTKFSIGVFYLFMILSFIVFENWEKEFPISKTFDLSRIMIMIKVIYVIRNF